MCAKLYPINNIRDKTRQKKQRGAVDDPAGIFNRSALLLSIQPMAEPVYYFFRLAFQVPENPPASHLPPISSALIRLPVSGIGPCP